MCESLPRPPGPVTLDGACGHASQRTVGACQTGSTAKGAVYGTRRVGRKRETAKMGWLRWQADIRQGRRSCRVVVSYIFLSVAPD